MGKYMDRYKELAFKAFDRGAYVESERYFKAAAETHLDDRECIFFQGMAAANCGTLTMPRL